jgi:formylglycine-generating enzyme required for sulfatase activity/mono/diheme cytochrome c family protein
MLYIKKIWKLKALIITLPFLILACSHFKDSSSSKQAFVQSPINYKRVPASKADLELAKKTLGIFTANCFSCHGEPGKKVRGGFDSVLDFDQLRANKDYIDLNNPDQSGLYLRIFNDEMPQGKEFRKLTADEKKTVLDWISAGAPSLEDKTKSVKDNAGTASYNYTRDAIAKDLAQFTEGEQKSIRYLSIAHMPGAGDKPEDIAVFRDALTKLVNSLSFEEDAKPLTTIDANKLIFRVNLDDYGWNKENRKTNDDIWEKLGQANPYNIFASDAVTEKIRELTGSQFPFLRGDWFTFVASQPPFYHDFLQLPNTDTELEAILGININNNISKGFAHRAAFSDSGVSKNNRMIERHKSQFGAYWKSYDFANVNGTSDLFTRPLGPGNGANDFVHDGGEIIFNLPNGLQGYLLVSAKNKRLDVAPVNIVQDTTKRDATIINGVSCMSCHSTGMKEKSDQLRDYALGHKNVYNEADFKQILKLYKPNDKLSAAFKEDTDRFIGAMKKSGVINLKGDLEPVRHLTDRFEKNVDTKRAAAELGVSEDLLLSKSQKNPEIAAIVSRMSGKGVPRSFFINTFEQLQSLLTQDEIPVEAGATAGGGTNKLGMKFISIAPGTFQMGSPTNEVGRDSDETQHQVTLTRGHEMQTTPVTQDQWTKVMGNNPSRFQGANRPVEQVSWNDAQEFIKKLNDTLKDGYKYRLPTEAEWEFAVRERGTKKTAYFFGDDASKLSQFAWFSDNSGGQTHDVNDNGLNSRNKNGLGLVDMSGNVWQWCEDIKGDYPNGAVTNPTGATSGSSRVLRGGSWNSGARDLRSAGRVDDGPGFRFSVIGFRLVRTR